MIRKPITGMNFHKAKILLDKINRLYEGMAIDKDNINPIERDLMLNYLRDLYESFYMEKSAPAPTAPKQKKTPPKPEPVKVVAPPPPPPPKPEPVPLAPKVNLKEEVEDLNREIKEIMVETPAPKPEPVKKAAPKPAPEPEQEPDKKPKKFKFEEPVMKVKSKKSNQDIDDESEALFEQKTATELSEKLSLSKITDLKKAFGLNDRMMYTNQLFGGDNQLFNETLEVLNSFNSLQQAKLYLIENVARKNGWTGKAKQKQAKEFIRTIQRKYV